MSSVLLLAGLSASAVAAQPGAPDTGSCAELFPEQPWQQVDVVSGVSVETVGIDADLGRRLVEDVARSAAEIDGDIASLQGVGVCVFSSEFTLESRGSIGENYATRAAAFLPEGVVVFNVAFLKDFDDGAAYGLSRIALWRRSVALGELGSPEPLASFVAARYVAQVTQTMAAARNVDNSVLLGRPAIGWVDVDQAVAIEWLPGGISHFGGGFIDWAVAEYGPAAIDERDPDVWDARVEEFLAQARLAATGSRLRSRDWLGGVAVVGGTIVIAIVAFFSGWYPRWKARRRRRLKRPSDPGFFESL